MKWNPALILATWFGCGFAPAAPGTVGALGALVPAWLLNHYAGWGPVHYLAAAALLVPPAIWAAGRVARLRNLEDPGMVVADEVIGQLVALSGATSNNWKAWVLAFALFRVFDIWKPFPARQLEMLPGGTGIVADDVAAGVWAALVLWLAGWFNLY